MKTVYAYLVAFYLCSISPVFSAEETHVDGHASEEAVEGNHYIHGEIAHKIEEGIHNAEHASKGGLPQFEPTWFASQIFWLAVAFAILYTVFAKKTLPDISSVIENRKNHIQSDLETAEKLTAEADNVHDAYHTNLEKSQSDASEAIQKVDAEIKSKAAEELDNFRARSEKEMLAVEGRILSAKNQAMGEMNAIAAEVASVAVEKIINKEANPSQIQSLIDGISKKAKAA